MSKTRLSLRRLVEAEVHEVGVAAQLGREPGVGRPGQVGRHEQRAAPVEGAGRDEHAPVADGHQLRDPVGRLLLEQADRVRAGRPAASHARVRGAGRPLARRLAARGALRRRQLARLGDLGQQFDHDASHCGRLQGRLSRGRAGGPGSAASGSGGTCPREGDGPCGA